MRRARWAAALTLVTTALTLVAGCTGGTGGDDPRRALTSGAELLAPGGSAHVRETLPLPLAGRNGDTVLEGTISWTGAGGSTGRLTLPPILGGPPSRSLFTSDASYVETGVLGPLASRGLPGLSGKKWIKQSYADLARRLGPIGEVARAAVDNTNPVRSAALLAQSPDLRTVGEEQVGGVSATHYSGQLRLADAVQDERLGLSRQVLDELRRQISATGGSDVVQYDLWVDDQGRPLRAQGRTGDPATPQTYTVEYSDYAGPMPVEAPPADEVVDLGRLTSGAFPFPR